MTGRVEKPILLVRLRTFIKSIRFRLTLWTAAILVVILFAFSIFVYYRQAQYLTIDARIQLQEQAQRLAPLYRYVGMAEPGLAAAPAARLYQHEQPGISRRRNDGLHWK